MLWRGRQEVPLQPRHFRLLDCLIKHSPSVVSRQELLETVSGDAHVQPATLDNAVSELRSFLRDRTKPNRIIENVRAEGYRFIAPLSARTQARTSRPRRLSRRVVLLTAAAVVFVGLLLYVSLTTKFNLAGYTQPDATLPPVGSFEFTLRRLKKIKSLR